MSNYRSPWARDFSNPLNRRKGESHSHHQYRTARYYVAVIVVIALALTAINSVDRRYEAGIKQADHYAGNDRLLAKHARQIEEGLR